jgi:hypothetical protein
MTETLDDLLNKIEAIFDCGVAQPIELARELGKKRQRIPEYVRQRKHRPTGDTAFKMKAWAARMSNRIAAAGSKTQNAYRSAYQDVCEKRRPGNGKD